MKIYGGQSERGKREQPHLVASILNREWNKDTLTFQAGADGEPQEKKDAAIRQFLHTLRGLVDQWIDSGKNKRDASIEEAWKRNIRWKSTDYPKPIITTLKDYWERNPPQAAIHGDGRSGIYVDRTFPRQTDVLRRARERAISEFVMLLDSFTRERLCRCDGCRTYFVRARAPKKDTPIFFGTFCPNSNCRARASEKRMNATRENRTKQMVELAAESWRDWKPTRHHGKQSKWIAARMNKTLRRSTGEEITGKWVTQHQQEIEAESERRSHAKS